MADPVQEDRRIDSGGKTVYRRSWSRYGYGLAFVAIVLLSAVNAFWRLDTAPVRDWDEARRGVAAHEMLESGNHLVHTYRGAVDYWSLKPPFWRLAPVRNSTCAKPFASLPATRHKRHCWPFPPANAVLERSPQPNGRNPGSLFARCCWDSRAGKAPRQHSWRNRMKVCSFSLRIPRTCRILSLSVETKPSWSCVDLLADILENGSRKEIVLTYEVKAQYAERGREMKPTP